MADATPDLRIQRQEPPVHLDASPPPVPDPAHVLLDAGAWAAALADLEPRARSGDEIAKRLLVELIEGPWLLAPPAGAGNRSRTFAPLPLRRKAAEVLGVLGDPRLLDLRTGTSPIGNYWCAIDAGPFWFGDDRRKKLRQETLPNAYRIGRYLVTNAEYRRFVEDGGYQQQQWWSEHGWQYLQPGSQRWREFNDERITQPCWWDNERYNQPGQPVVGISWYEAAAYCTWLTAQGHAQGWLPTTSVLRLPTSLEWERAARHTDRRRYPWGDAKPDAERANYQATGIGAPTAVGCLPVGAAACGALDMLGNVQEWLATPAKNPARQKPQEDFTAKQKILLAYADFRDEVKPLCCGARRSWFAGIRMDFRGFRVIYSLAHIASAPSTQRS